MAKTLGASLEGLRAQVQLHSHIAIRDLPKRIVTVQFPIFAIWQSGLHAAALFNLAALLVLETAIFVNTRTMARVTLIPAWRIGAVLGLSGAVSICYYAPGVVLASQADFGLAMGGMVWIMAALSTNLVMYNALRALFWTTAIAGFPAALIAVSFVAGKEVTPVAGYSWLLPVSIVCLHLVNTVQQLREYRDTHRELEDTRASLLGSLRKLEHMSLHDALTGLGNRSAFQTRLEQMAQQVSKGQVLGVFMIDLNGFKPINDTYGHAAGDAVLVATAQRLQQAERAGAVAFRLGGDEFAVLSLASSRLALQQLGDRLAAAIREPIAYERSTLLLGASIGVALAQAPRADLTLLCAVADQAMYDAKAAKLKTALIGDPDGLKPGVDLTLQADLENALRRGDILPYYQPKFTSDGARLVGFQALARWRSPTGRIFDAQEFVADIEQVGLMPELTQAMLRAVLADLSGWCDLGLNIGKVSVNMPVVSLATESRREELEWQLAEYAALSRRLAFEITEEVYTHRSSDAALTTLRRFSQLGVAVYLDDFGTGHGSYQHLRQFTPDEIKIDGSLVADMGRERAAVTVIEGIINIAHGVGARVVAEAVETEPQRAQLHRLGCDFVEGYLFAEAMPAQDVADMLRLRALG